MRTADFAIDLGTACSRIAIRGRGVVGSEPSIVALKGAGRARVVHALGEQAREMVGRTPDDIRVVRPVRSGVVADFEASEHLVRHMVSVSGSRSLLRPRIVLPIPGMVTEVERRAILDSTKAAGAREAAVLPAPLAAALGAGLTIDEPIGRLVVDVGAGAIQVAVISLGGIVLQQSARIGGDDLDEAVALWIRGRRGIVVGVSQCTSLREAAETATAPLPVRGRDVQTGRPRETTFSNHDLVEAIAEPLARMRDVVSAVLADTPPELSADIHDTGVVVCGGCGLSRQVGSMLRDATGVPVARASEPGAAVIRGAALMLDNPDLLHRLTDSR